MKPIKVPRTPKTSFNPDRRPSALLLGQIEHLEWAARPAAQRQPKEMKRALAKGKPRTEAEAAERIAALTRKVLENAAAERLRTDASASAQQPVAAPSVTVASTTPRPKARAKKPVTKKPRRKKPRTKRPRTQKPARGERSTRARKPARGKGRRR